MSFRDTQNPGIGGLDEITDAETLVLQQLAGLSYSNGDILYYNNGQFRRLPKGSDTQVLTLASGLPAWSATAGGGADALGSYIVKTAANAPANAQVLGSLSTGLMKVTTTTGVISVAVSGTDYAPATSGSAILKGNGSGGFSSAVSSTDYAPATSGSAILKGNGSGGFSAAVANTDYAATNVATLSSLVSIGTITTGTWNATVVAGQYGGTGVNNSGKTITLGGNLTTSGAFATTFTATAITAVTLPTTGTLATLAGAEAFSNKTITSPKIVTDISDTNGNELFKVVATSSAINEITVSNAATGGTPSLIATGGDTNIDFLLQGKGSGKVKLTSHYGALTADADAATITFDLAASNIHTATLGGNRTLAISNAAVGQCFILRLQQDGTGTRVPTWFTTIKWAGGVAPTLTTTINKADMFGFFVTSSGNYDGFVIGQNL